MPPQRLQPARRRAKSRGMPRTVLPDRGVVEIAGEDRIGFLQGLVSNDVALASATRAVWAALLTPQGKWLADFFVTAPETRLLLDCERAQAAMLVQRLGRFRLRSRVTLIDASAEHVVMAGWGETPPPQGAAADPRLPAAGWRAILPSGVAGDGDPAAWDAHRLALGLPDGSRDLDTEHSVLLEAGFDELGGISWTKGCYMGQELTARTRYRGLVKRRLVPVTVTGALPAPESPIMLDGREVGRMRSGLGQRGMALLRLEALTAATLECGDATLVPIPPAWLRLPASAA